MELGSHFVFVINLNFYTIQTFNLLRDPRRTIHAGP
ncbi:MAG: hypothetical protein ACJA08_000839 [Cyclobacteriaceae bacterium]